MGRFLSIQYQVLCHLYDGVHVDPLSADGDTGEGRVLHWLVRVLNRHFEKKNKHFEGSCELLSAISIL